MSRISFTQINSLPDILDASAFELVMGNIPLAGGTQDLTLKCQQVSIPGYSNEAFEALLHGHVLKFRGRKMYPRTLSVTFLEDSTFATWNKLKLWDEFIAGTDSGNSQAFKEIYTINPSLVIYNTIGAVASTIKFENFFIQEVSDVQLDGTSSQALNVQAMFSYDRIIPNGIPVL